MSKAKTPQPITPDQLKLNFQQHGKTFSQWAKDNGYRVNQVYRVVNGQSKAKYGQDHEIAVKLGLKVIPQAA